MADNVQFTVNADSTPPNGTLAATDELADGSHAGIAKLAISADGDRTLIPATAADGLLVNLGANNDVTVTGSVTTGGLTDAQLRATPVPVDVDAPLGQAAMAASIPVVVASNQSAVPVSAASLPLPTGAATLAEQQTQTASLSVLDDWDETNRAAVNVIAGQVGVAGGSGVDSALTQRVSLATNVALPAGTNNIGDVDVLTLPSIPAGTNNIGDVDVLTMPVTEIVGDVAADVAVPANPVAVGGRASDALPTEVSADGRSVYQWLLRNGAAVTAELPHLGMLGDPYTLASVTAQYTTTQTSTVLVNPGGGQRVAVVSIQIQAGGTTAGTLQVYFGTGAYSRGTTPAIFDGEFAPSATLKPGFAMAPPKPWIGAADDDVRVTDSAAVNPLTITLWYYLIG